MKKVLLTMLFLTIYGITLAQERTVSGRLINSTDGEPIPGVTIQLKGSPTGTITDVDGKYTIKIPNEDAILQFSFVGFASQEVTVGRRAVIDIELSEDSKQLSEVVVVGYGVQRKQDLVGSVGVATNEDFGDVSVSNASQLVQGKVAGLQVINNGGLPGEGTSFIVRGVGSFTNASPLYVIDGMQTNDASVFNSLSPFDIESITILKDASSIAIYGAQGANGVVIVTTKKGKTGEPKITYNSYVGLAQPWRRLEPMNAKQYNEFVKDVADAQGTTNLPSKLDSDEVLVDKTNWMDEIIRNAVLSEHYIGLSGATDKVNYNLSAGYTSQESFMVGYKYERMSLKLNTEAKLGSRVRIGQNLNLRYEIDQGNAASFTDALRMPPYMPVYDATQIGGLSRPTTQEDLNDAYHPLINPTLREKKIRGLQTYAQFFGEVDLLKNLTFRSQGSILFNHTHTHEFQNEFIAQNGLFNDRQLKEGHRWDAYPLLENILTFNKSFGNHNINVIAGNTYRGAGFNQFTEATGTNFVNSEIKQLSVARSQTVTGSSGGPAVPSLISYFGRVNYTLKDKYLFSASYRTDGSSVFGPENRWGTFPSFGTGWRVSEEEFMKDIPMISELKIRASWGKMGNANIPQFLYTPTVFMGDGGNYIVYSFGDGFVNGATMARAFNSSLKWEETTQTDIGVDFGLFDHKLNVSLDLYNRQNNDLLIYTPIPMSTGIGGIDGVQLMQPNNAASAFNRGIEASVTYDGTWKSIRYSVNANGSYNQNRVTSLGDENVEFIAGGQYEGIFLNRTQPNQPLGAFYGYRVDKVAADQAVIDNLNQKARDKTGNEDAEYQSGLLPGDIIFKDLDGDGIVDSNDQEFLGNPTPRFNYGGNFNLWYKNFDFMVSVNGIAGVEIANAYKFYTEGMYRPFNTTTDVLDRWRKEGDQASIPRAGQNATPDGNMRPSDRFIEKGDFMRVRNLTIGYSIPKDLLQAWSRKSISNLRVYLTGQNVFTFTKFRGLDPEVTGLENDLTFSRGMFTGNLPQPKTYMVGIQVAF